MDCAKSTLDPKVVLKEQVGDFVSRMNLIGPNRSDLCGVACTSNIEQNVK